MLQLAFDGHSDNPHLPENYMANSVVYTGTHDSPTTRGWYEDLPTLERQNLWRYPAPKQRCSRRRAVLIRAVWSSDAALAMAPLQDVLNLGKDARHIPDGPKQLALARYRGDAARASASNGCGR